MCQYNDSTCESHTLSENRVHKLVSHRPEYGSELAHLRPSSTSSNIHPALCALLWQNLYVQEILEGSKAVHIPDQRDSKGKMEGRDGEGA